MSEEQEAADNDVEDQSGGTANQEDNGENAQPSCTNHQSTLSSVQPSTSRLMSFPLNDQALKIKHNQLRRWNMNAPPLIEPQPMKRRRGRQPQEPVAGPSNGSLPQGAPKKRGRPPKDLKEKLAAIVPPKDNKPKEPKPNRDLKVKITENNRGSFLCQLPDQNQDDDTSEDTDEDSD